MAADNTRKKSSLWNFVDNFEGDKVVWMIVLLLIMISIVAIFSSTTLLARTQNTTRMAIMGEQFAISALGLVIIFICYSIKKIGFFRVLSQFGFIFSLLMILIVDLHLNLGVVKAAKINNAWRFIIFFGRVQVNVAELVKVPMILYLAWAANAFKNDKFWIANKLAKTKRFAFMGKPMWKKVLYIYLPMMVICAGLLPGGFSSPVFIAALMFATILIGGIGIKELIVPGLAIAGLVVLLIGINLKLPEDSRFLPHVDSIASRLEGGKTEKNIAIMKENPTSSQAFQNALDEIKQQYSAKIAVHQGGIIGKGPGRSTQKYIVPIIFEDFMYSFLIEEYGLVGGIIVIILYISLLARGSIIARNCDNLYAKTAVAGLVILITAQAFMHMMINVGLFPLTGQTLPMISHGNGSFLVFSLAFGIILSISRIAKKKIEREAVAFDKAEAKALEEYRKDEVRSSMDDLNQLDQMGAEDYGLDDHNNV